MEKKIDASGHFARVLDGGKLPTIVRHAVSLLKDVKFDTLAFIGYSGAVLAPIIAYEMGKELLMVRKRGGRDNSNSSRWIEGHVTAERVVVVDDLISSGCTMSQMMHALRSLQSGHNPGIQIAALLLHVYFEEIDGVYQARPKLFLPNESAVSSFQTMVVSEKRFSHPVSGVMVDYSERPPLY